MRQGIFGFLAAGRILYMVGGFSLKNKSDGFCWYTWQIPGENLTAWAICSKISKVHTSEKIRRIFKKHTDGTGNGARFFAAEGKACPSASGKTAVRRFGKENMAKYKYGDIRVYAKSYLRSMLYTKPRRTGGNGLLRACMSAAGKALRAAGRLVKSPFSFLARRKKAKEERLYGPFSPLYSQAPALALGDGEVIPIAPEKSQGGANRWVWGLLCSLMACAGLVAMIGSTAAGRAQPVWSVVVSDDAKTAATIASRAETVGEMLAEAGIVLAEGDEVQPSEDTP